mmetsp:Transcript_10108/g.32522  ORF Transcript_10108/g.32522 Transcript_10108/m.32522 type:complete len:183 (+) Transcript_10108:802-1350(+)
MTTSTTDAELAATTPTTPTTTAGTTDQLTSFFLSLSTFSAMPPPPPPPELPAARPLAHSNGPRRTWRPLPPRLRHREHGAGTGPHAGPRATAAPVQPGRHHQRPCCAPRYLSFSSTRGATPHSPDLDQTSRTCAAGCCTSIDIILDDTILRRSLVIAVSVVGQSNGRSRAASQTQLPRELVW